jgi:hypothetical protein
LQVEVGIFGWECLARIQHANCERCRMSFGIRFYTAISRCFKRVVSLASLDFWEMLERLVIVTWNESDETGLDDLLFTITSSLHLFFSRNLYNYTGICSFIRLLNHSTQSRWMQHQPIKLLS